MQQPRQTGGRETGICLQTDDIDTVHAQLKAAGADVDPNVSRVGALCHPPSGFATPKLTSAIIVTCRRCKPWIVVCGR